MLIRKRRAASRRTRFSLIFIVAITFSSVLILFAFLLSHYGLEHHHQHQLHVESPIAQALGAYNNNNNNKNEPSSSSSSSSSPPPPLINWDEIYPREDPLPNPTPIPDGNSTFAACMLVMDDNHRLTEWLAYHYHVLPLRYLVITADPRSKTSPSHILNQWRARGMVIEEWVDRDFWRKDLKLAPIPDDAALQTKRDRHRGRQKFFYRSCLIYLKKQNRTWVSLHDTDEYLVYNHAGGAQFRAWEDEQLRRHALSKQHGHQTRIQPSQIPPPTTAKEGGMIQYIRHEQAAGLEYYQSPCIGIPRLTFSAVESTQAEQQHNIPTSLLSLQQKSSSSSSSPTTTSTILTHLDTIRWRKHAPRNDFVKNALGKVLIDVSRVDMERTPQFMSLHRPIKSICPAPWHNDWESGLRINHYLGSWESYSFRDDARRGFERSREQWEYKSSSNADMTDDNIRPWLTGLVETHGVETAQEWLQGAGLPAGYQPRNDGRSWHLLPDKLQEILAVNETATSDGKKAAFDSFVRQKYKKTTMNDNNNNQQQQ